MNYTKKTLQNGLRTIHVPMEGTKTVTVLLLVGVGSRYETKKINGISHFLEHMFFKGTKKRPDKSAIARELDAVGAEYNAYTSKEFTGYFVKADSKHADLAFDVISDMFLNSTLPAEEIEKERGVILGEIDMYEDMPQVRVGWLFDKLLYGNQPVGWDVLGTKEVIKSVQRDDFIKYHDTHYRAKNTVAIVAGNIQKQRAEALMQEYFSATASGSTTDPKKVSEEQKEPQLHIEQKETDQTHLVLGTRAFDMHDERRWALAVLSVILGGNMSSRLFIRIRDELGLGYYVRSSTSLRTDHGYFDVSAGVQTARIKEAVEAIMAELKRMRDKKVGASELKKAQEYIRGNSLLSLESSSNVASFFVKQELLGKKVLTPEEKFRMIEEVTAEDVQQVARDIFTNDRLNLALIGPVDEEDDLKKELTFN